MRRELLPAPKLYVPCTLHGNNVQFLTKFTLSQVVGISEAECAFAGVSTPSRMTADKPLFDPETAVMFDMVARVSVTNNETVSRRDVFERARDITAEDVTKVMRSYKWTSDQLTDLERTATKIVARRRNEARQDGPVTAEEFQAEATVQKRLVARYFIQNAERSYRGLPPTLCEGLALEQSAITAYHVPALRKIDLRHITTFFDIPLGDISAHFDDFLAGVPIATSHRVSNRTVMVQRTGWPGTRSLKGQAVAVYLEQSAPEEKNALLLLSMDAMKTILRQRILALRGLAVLARDMYCLDVSPATKAQPADEEADEPEGDEEAEDESGTDERSPGEGDALAAASS